MRAPRLGFALLAAAVGLSAVPAGQALSRAQAPSSASRALPAGAERAYQAMLPAFDAAAAMEVVTFMQQYWRVAGNPGYNASIDEISRRLTISGFRVQRTTEYAPFQRIDEYAGAPGWDHSRATLTIDGDPAPIFSREQDRVALAINSFSTAEGGTILPLVDVGRGTPRDYDGKTIRGAVVLGDASLGSLWREAVRNRGARGVISTEIASYIRPADPSQMTEEQKDVFQWGSVPYDESLKAFAFKASYRATSRLRTALAANPGTRVRVDIRSTFYRGPHRTLVAEIPGSQRPEERIVIVAHVQEPGANDNASGCATLLALAEALNTAIADGRLPRPGRTLTFMWVDEIRGSRQWLSSRPSEAKGVRYMFSMDMTGQDTAKTGGTFLIEKQADPSAVWPRPSDPHSEWGAGEVKPESLSGSLLNDLHIAIARRRAQDTGWVVRANPYEGGSDHTVFAHAGVPSLLNWHFTDRYYHSNQDTIDKVSAAEMANVGIAVATSAYLLASADEADALTTVRLVQDAGVERLALERHQGPALVSRAADRAQAEKTEAEVIASWIRWYHQALDDVARLPVAGASATLRARIEGAKARIN